MSDRIIVTMDAPAEVLEELKCNECHTYLSRSPIYLQHDGAAACGRCLSPKRPATRNKQYETVAKLLRFPCKNQDLGCRETVGFVDEGQDVAHEAVCEFRQYVCPVLGSSSCDWLGTRSQILQHCRAEHPDRVLDHPCRLTHDIITSSLHNYVLQAFHLLFLLHTKVCVTSGKIYHSVRLLDAPEMAKCFIYILHISRGDEELSKKGDVAPQGCLVLQEPTALALNINSLLSVLGGWDGTTFTMTVKQLEQGKEAVLVTRLQNCSARQRQVKETCAGCKTDMTVMLYRDERGWRCKRCAPARRACGNQAQGCTHQEILPKCKKHESYFCEQSTRCCICRAFVSRGTLAAHFTSAHRDVTHNAGATWRATTTERCCLVTCPAGTAVCWYGLCNSQLDLRVYVPVLSERLCEFRCVVRVKQPTTGLTRTYTPDVTYKEFYDWRIQINKMDFPLWSSSLEISVNIDRFYI